MNRIVECCVKLCSFIPNSVEGLCILFLSGGIASGLDMLAEVVERSGPFDDLYHLNRRAGAASIGSGFVTLTTLAVSSGTSCSVAEADRDESDGEPDGWPRFEKMVGVLARAMVSCIVSA